MLEEILHTISISPQIEKIVIVTKEEKAIAIGKKFNAIIIKDKNPLPFFKEMKVKNLLIFNIKKRVILNE